MQLGTSEVKQEISDEQLETYLNDRDAIFNRLKQKYPEMTQWKNDMESVAGEAICEAVETHDEEKGQSLRTWVNTKMEWAMRQEYDKNLNRTVREELESPLELKQPTDNSILRKMIAQEERNALAQALSEMTPKEQFVLDNYYYYERSRKEIAKELGGLSVQRISQICIASAETLKKKMIRKVGVNEVSG